MSEENKAIVGRWFTEFWGNPWNPSVVDELAAPDIRFEYSMHAPRRGREDVKKFATEFRAAFPDLNFWGTADLIAEGEYVVGQWRWHAHRESLQRSAHRFPTGGLGQEDPLHWNLRAPSKKWPDHRGAWHR